MCATVCAIVFGLAARCRGSLVESDQSGMTKPSVEDKFVLSCSGCDVVASRILSSRPSANSSKSDLYSMECYRESGLQCSKG